MGAEYIDTLGNEGVDADKVTVREEFGLLLGKTHTFLSLRPCGTWLVSGHE